MSTKTAVQAQIDSKIRNKTPKVVKAEHADVEDALLGEIYPDFIDETSASPVYTVATSNTLYPYFARFQKKGGRMFIDLWLQNTQFTTVSNVTIFTLPATVSGNPNFLLPDDSNDPATSVPFVFRGEGVRAQDEDRIRVLMLDEAGTYKFRISGTLPGGSTGENWKYRVQMSYKTKY